MHGFGKRDQVPGNRVAGLGTWDGDREFVFPTPSPQCPTPAHKPQGPIGSRSSNIFTTGGRSSEEAVFLHCHSRERGNPGLILGSPSPIRSRTSFRGDKPGSPIQVGDDRKAAPGEGQQPWHSRGQMFGNFGLRRPRRRFQSGSAATALQSASR